MPPTWHTIGMTGSRSGLTDEAREALVRTMQEVGGVELHHGDCVGADASAHAEALKLGLRVVVHPPIVETQRAWCAGHPRSITILPPLAYIPRDHRIVDSVDGLIVLPGGFDEKLRSGTWATYRYARGKIRASKRQLTPVVVIFPDGTRRWETEPRPVHPAIARLTSEKGN